MAALVRGGTVLPHVQAFADAVSAATGADSFGTYPGHEPTEDRAVDCFVPTTSSVLGDAICAFAIDNLDRFGIWYLIYRQRIYNPKIASYWRPMEDRGSLTQNHFDHVHLSFEASAPAPTPTPTPPPNPTPTPSQKDDDMKVTYNSGGYIWAYADQKLVRLTHPDQATAARKAGAVDLSDVSDPVHEFFTALAGPERVIIIGDQAK